MGEQFRSRPSPALFEGFGHFSCHRNASCWVDGGEGGQGVAQPLGAFEGDGCSWIGGRLSEERFGLAGQKAEELEAACVEAGKDEGLDEAARAGDGGEREPPLDAGLDEELPRVVDAGGSGVGNQGERLPFFQIGEDAL